MCSKAEPLSVERWVLFVNMEVTSRSGLTIFRIFDLPSILSRKIMYMNLKGHVELKKFTCTSRIYSEQVSKRCSCNFD